MELGHTSYVILGMLGKGPKSGYDIKSLADNSTRFFWAISYGQIYPELKRLEQAGLIVGEADPSGGGRQRRVFTLTPEGEQALHDWLTAGGPLHFELRHEGILRIFFSGVLDVEERVALLHAVRAGHERVRDEIEQVRPLATEAAAESGDPMPLLTVETGVAYQEFFVGLCDRLERRLEEIQTPVPGGS
jgi:PadR family transcriptional regulator, regulatory protein AphA